MNLESLLTEKKKAIIQKWIELVLDSYGSSNFFKKQKDRFANPVGATISEGLTKIFTVLVENRDLNDIAKPLEDIIKIRAVQDFAPSQAVSFIYLFKDIVRQELAREKKLAEMHTNLAVLEARIDKTALMAFDYYMDCRERLHRIRVNEVLSGRSALTDGSQCISAVLRRNQTESADNNQNNRLT